MAENCKYFHLGWDEENPNPKRPKGANWEISLQAGMSVKYNNNTAELKIDMWRMV